MDIKDMTTEELKNEIVNAITAYNEKYLEVHPVDWDCCGFAWISMFIGRKTKVTKFIESIGLFSVDKSSRYGKVCYNINTLYQEVPDVGHQSLTYKEGKYKVILDILRQRPELEGIDIYVHSMMD